jgi:hypothetical protein
VIGPPEARFAWDATVPLPAHQLRDIIFEDEDAYRRGDEILNAMPAGDTPGQRTSVARYDVAMRMTA